MIPDCEASYMHEQAKERRNERLMQAALGLLFSISQIAFWSWTADSSAPFQTPDEGEDKQENGRRRLAHGVERERDEHQRVVGQPDVQAR